MVAVSVAWRLQHSTTREVWPGADWGGSGVVFGGLARGLLGGGGYFRGILYFLVVFCTLEVFCTFWWYFVLFGGILYFLVVFFMARGRVLNIFGGIFYGSWEGIDQRRRHHDSRYPCRIIGNRGYPTLAPFNDSDIEEREVDFP